MLTTVSLSVIWDLGICLSCLLVNLNDIVNYYCPHFPITYNGSIPRMVLVYFLPPLLSPIHATIFFRKRYHGDSKVTENMPKLFLC